jgi:hypothetical protein
MKVRVGTILVGVFLCLAPVASWADLAPYGQDFEGLVPAPQAPESSLGEDGWKFFANGFDAFGNYLFGYGPFPAPNHGEAISAVVLGQGGSSQGAQQLSVFSNYGDPVHGVCDDSTSEDCIFLESNVFQEQVIGAADVGTTWRFEFDAKRGNIEGVTTAKAFIKTLHPTQFWLSSFIFIDMTGVPSTWDGYSRDIFIAPELEGHILQFGFLNTATAYEGSGIYYDNVGFDLAPLRVDLDIKPGGCPNPFNGRSQGLFPVALLGTADFNVSDIDVDSLQLEGVDPFLVQYEDVAEPFAGDLCGCTEAGPDGILDLSLKFRTEDLVAAIGPIQRGDRVLTLTGALLDGTAIEGQDCVVVLVGGGGRSGDQPGSSPASLRPTRNSRKALSGGQSHLQRR